jgi:hypothetical protein
LKYIPYLAIFTIIGIATAGLQSLPSIAKEDKSRSSASTVPPRFWALVHADDTVAANRLLSTRDVPSATLAAKALGYEPVRDGDGVYFFPVPAWSAGVGNTLNRLLSKQSRSDFGSEFASGELTSNEREHLTNFLHRYAGQSIRGELGGMIRESKLGTMRFEMQVDLKVESGGKEYTVPLQAGDLGKWLNVKPSAKPAEVPKEPSFTRRKELYGLGARAFSITLKRSTNFDAFDRVHDRARQIYKLRRAEQQKELDRHVRGAFGAVLYGEEASSLLNGQELKFTEMPAGVKIGLQSLVGREPGMIGAENSNEAFALLSSATYRFPTNGQRLFLNFVLGAGGRASDGSPVRYSVSWELKDIFDKAP